METFALYMLKSTIWLSGFALVYILFLRNERFFHLNRLYLITGILVSFVFPMISIHYTVYIPVTESIINKETIVAMAPGSDKGFIRNMAVFIFIVYISGALFVFSRLMLQIISVFRKIKGAETIPFASVKLIRSADYTSSFSLFSYVFVNPSVTDQETREIMNHEIVHISQLHWIDLSLIELLCILQWFNPVVWIYSRLIKQNHEYLADEVALQRTSDPAIYKAALLNQIIGSPVINLANSFNYSLNKKRFNMMTNRTTSMYRKLKIFLILPVFAIVLYSFAKPDYRYTSMSGDQDVQGNQPSLLSGEVKGKVLGNDGKPLSGATLIVTGTSRGVLTDASGHFRVDNVRKDALIAVSAPGYNSKVVKPDFKSEMVIEMISDPDYKESDYNGIPQPQPPTPPSSVKQNKNIRNVEAALPPPPPPPEDLNIRSENGIPPLIVLDGIVTDIDINTIDPVNIRSVNVIKGNSAIVKYGDDGKNGVIEITTKKSNSIIEPVISEVEVIGYGSNQKSKAEPIVVIDGKITNIDIETIDPESIESINVLKDESAINKYGEKGKNGVIEIVIKK